MRQQQDSTPLSPDTPTHALFVDWAERDAHMTEDERIDEDRLWEDLEKSLIENKGSRLRTR